MNTSNNNDNKKEQSHKHNAVRWQLCALCLICCALEFVDELMCKQNLLYFESWGVSVLILNGRNVVHKDANNVSTNKR